MPKNKRIPISALNSLPSFHMEVDKTVGGISLACNGVKGINEFSENEVELKLCGFFLRIKGKKLRVSVFEESFVEIIGSIAEVSFVYAKT